MNLFLIILFIFALVIIIADWFPQFYIWQSRIKIGQFSDENSWKERVKLRSISWLNHMPRTKIKDQNKFVIFDILTNQYTNKTLQSWQEASLLLGLNELAEKAQGSKIEKEIQKFIHSKIDENGNWKINPTEIDAALLTFALSKTQNRAVENIKNAEDYIFQLIQSKIGEDGTVCYRTSVKNYRYVDTVGFICPFLTYYGVKNNHEEAIDLAIIQIKNFEKYGLLENKIPCHTYEIHSKNQVGIFAWGRGIAWFVIGVLETYIILPENHKEKKHLYHLLEEISQTLRKFQHKDGSFSWNIFDENSRKDSSATAVFAWFFKEMNLDKESQNALNYLKSVTRRDGSIDFSQGDTKGIGVYSQNFDILPFTQGYFLRAIK